MKEALLAFLLVVPFQFACSDEVAGANKADHPTGSIEREDGSLVDYYSMEDEEPAEVLLTNLKVPVSAKKFKKALIATIKKHGLTLDMEEGGSIPGVKMGAYILEWSDPDDEHYLGQWVVSFNTGEDSCAINGNQTNVLDSTNFYPIMEDTLDRLGLDMETGEQRLRLEW